MNAYLRHLRYLPIIVVSTYVLFISLILNPQIQAHNVFLHGINFPFHLDLSKPEKIKSLPQSRVRNFSTVTSDGITISGWHLLPEGYIADQTQESFDRALQEKPTLVYFHGNSMNRAAPFRIHVYKQFIALGINVVAVDYRGFGDSQGTPSEEGLQRDARAVYKWIMQRKSDSGDDIPIHIAGQSLGTGVAARLALDLVRAGHPAASLFMIAPFTSIRNLLTSYKIGGLLPIFWPLGLWKVLSDLADRHLHTRFESDNAIRQIITLSNPAVTSGQKESDVHLDYTLSESDLRRELGLPTTSTSGSKVETRILIAHADDDRIIPHAHGRSLFDTIVIALKQTDIRQEDHPWGVMYTLKSKSGTSHTLIKSKKGGHNGVPAHAVELFGEINSL